MGFFDFFKSDDSNNSSNRTSDNDKRTSERDSKKDDDIDIDELIQSSVFAAASIDG